MKVLPKGLECLSEEETRCISGGQWLQGFGLIGMLVMIGLGGYLYFKKTPPEPVETKNNLNTLNNNLNTLNNQVFVKIGGFLDDSSLYKLSLTSKALHTKINELINNGALPNFNLNPRAPFLTDEQYLNFIRYASHAVYDEKTKLYNEKWIKLNQHEACKRSADNVCLAGTALNAQTHIFNEMNAQKLKKDFDKAKSAREIYKILTRKIGSATQINEKYGGETL